MIRSRRQNWASLPQALSRDAANTHWHLSATMLSCPWSIWDSFRGIQSHTHNGSFGWITIKIHKKIKCLKVPTYDVVLDSIAYVSKYCTLYLLSLTFFSMFLLFIIHDNILYF